MAPEKRAASPRRLFGMASRDFGRSTSGREERLLRAIQYASSALDCDQPLRLTLHKAEMERVIRCNRNALYRFSVGVLVILSAALAPFTATGALGDLVEHNKNRLRRDRQTTDATNGAMLCIVALLSVDLVAQVRMRSGGTRSPMSTRLVLRIGALCVSFGAASLSEQGPFEDRRAHGDGRWTARLALQRAPPLLRRSCSRTRSRAWRS